MSQFFTSGGQSMEIQILQEGPWLSWWMSEWKSVISDSLRPHGPYSPWNSPGQNTGVGSLSLLQGIFPTQGLNPVLQHCRGILYRLSHKGNPRILEWVDYPLFRGSSQSRNRTGVSCIAGRFFTHWTIREARKKIKKKRALTLASGRQIQIFPLLYWFCYVGQIT